MEHGHCTDRKVDNVFRTFRTIKKNTACTNIKSAGVSIRTELVFWRGTVGTLSEQPFDIFL